MAEDYATFGDEGLVPADGSLDYNGDLVQRCSEWFEPEAHSASRTHTCRLPVKHPGRHCCPVCDTEWSRSATSR